MKTGQNNSNRSLRRFFRQRRRRHDQLLLLNMVMFNFTDRWIRIFSNEHHARFSA
jgi:hypothetical protein